MVFLIRLMTMLALTVAAPVWSPVMAEGEKAVDFDYYVMAL